MAYERDGRRNAMRRIILFALLALTMLGGVAAADRYRGHHDGRYRGSAYVQRRYPRSVYRSQPRYYHNTRYYQPRVHVVRRPIYVQRPVIRYRYYNYYQRPAVIAENYSPMTGYYWVPGQWTWNGYEWIWQAGHYEPDAAYDSSYYDTPSYSY
jgi:hypothetical protein